MATSDDDGATWSRRGQILTSPAISKTSCEDMVFHGNYSFSATIEPTGQYVYLWFSQGSDESWDDGLGGLRIARAPLSDGLLPGTWEKWYHGDWTEPGLGGRASQHRNGQQIKTYQTNSRLFRASLGTLNSRPTSLCSQR
jgi:hypothetical protein